MTGDQAAVANMLRQLAMGLSTYRLFPGDLEQPAFQAATERIRSATRDALSAGPVDVEIHGEGFVGDGLEGSDEKRAQLAYALYERGGEWLEVTSVPDREELAAFFEQLSEPADELTDAGGLARKLRERGVTALAVRGAKLDADEPARGRPEIEFDDEQRELWNRLQDPESFAASLLVGGLDGRTPADQADGVYRRFQTVLGVLPDALANSPDVFTCFRQILDHLPRRVRRSFHALSIGRIEKDRLSQGYIGTTPDADLARMLVDLGEEGPDPLDLAARLVSVAGRREDVVDFTRALAQGSDAGGEEGGAIYSQASALATIPADRDEEIARSHADEQPDEQPTVTRTAADLLARGISLASDSDLAYVRQMFPATDEDARTLALTALRDYLSVESEVERLGQALESCAGGLRHAAREGDIQRFTRLLSTVDEARGAHEGERAGLFDAHLKQVLDEALVRDLVDRAREHGIDDIVTYLAPFGAVAVDRLLDALAVEDDRTMRSRLVGLICDLAQPRDDSTGHGDVVGRRLRDERWYVVRNAVTILQRIGGAEALPFVVQASQHPEPRVRRESVRALAAIAGSDAVPYLRRLALDRSEEVAHGARETLAGIPTPAAAAAMASVTRAVDDRSEQRRLLDRLAEHPADETVEHLERLASRRVRPKLAWRLRRHAKRLAKARRASDETSDETSEGGRA